MEILECTELGEELSRSLACPFSENAPAPRSRGIKG